MSRNGTNACEDAEMGDCDGEKLVTMVDVLKEQEDFEEDANAVLGASDDKNCTYSKGYIKRQAIYACMTCCADASHDPTKWAGVCLACSLTCHESHDLIELYTKRNFRCDCGNPKFNAHPCQFTLDKTELNIDNIYNQNFAGEYCVCHRPYPDPEVDTQGDMIQCIICEDWLHSNHLEALVPPNDQYSEMICKACMDKNEFLHDYSELAVNKENMDVDILNTTSEITTTNKNIENTNAQALDSENIENLNSDNIESKQTKKNDVGKVSDEDLINNMQKNDSEQNTVNKHISDDSKEDQQKRTVNSDSATNNDQNIINADESQNDNNNADKDNDSADVNMTANASEKTQDKINEKGVTSKEKECKAPENPENINHVQVEEVLVLADPTETELEQNKDDVASSNTTQSNKNKSEKQFDSEAMDTSEPDNENKDKLISHAEESENIATELTNHSENVIIEEQTENMTTAELTENKNISEQTGNVTAAEQTAEEPRTEESKDVPVIGHLTSEQVTAAKRENLEEECLESDTYAVQSLTASNIEQSVVVSTTETENSASSKESEQLKEPKETESLTEKLEHVGEAVVDKDNPSDVMSDENVTGNSINNDILNSDCDKEVLVNKVETDMLKRKLSTDTDTENVEVKKPKLEESKCVRPKSVKKMYHGATFWPSNFRHKLCTCNECISMYKDLSVLFLIDPEDTVTAYETLGKDITDGKPASQYEKGMAALSSLGRVQQINALTEYAKLRDKLLDFLKTFKEKKVIVKEEDIKAFFAGMKPVREPDGVYFCR